MSKVVDERVVAMEFDNSKFEKNVQTSMSTLDKLKKALRLEGSAKAAQSEFASYKAGVFSLKDAVNKAWASLEHDVGIRIKNLAKMFTIDPVKTGLQEYETQLNSVQTILSNTASKGTTLEDVNKTLDELNTYADKTIYNFSEMTKNIGTFTAAGVDLETAATSIKGIANLGAMVGSTPQQVATAMYQLSQAISSGTVRLMDWNSVVNAGMGGEVFRTELLKTAKAHGKAVDDIIANQGLFRESLSDGWLTADILTETLTKFTDTTTELGQRAEDAATKVKTFTQLIDTLKESAQSGWSQTWRLVIGDYEEAKEMWSKVSDELSGLIGKSADKRNKMLADALDSGWEKFLTAGNVFDDTSYLEQVTYFAKKQGVELDKMKDSEGKLLTITQALRKSLADKTLTADVLSQSLDELARRYSRLTDEQLKEEGITRKQIDAFIEFNRKIQNGEESINKIADSIASESGREKLVQSFANLYNSIKNVTTAIGEAWESVFPSDNIGQTLYNIIEKFRHFTSIIRDFTENHAEKIERTFQGLFSIFKIGWMIVKGFVTVIGKVIGQFSGLGGGLLTVFATIGDFFTELADGLEKTKWIEQTVTNITNVIESFGNALKGFKKNVKVDVKAPGLEKFYKFLLNLWDVVKTVFVAITNVISNVGKSVAESIDGSGITTVFQALNAGLLASIFFKIRNVFSSVSDIMEGFAEVLEGAGEVLKGFQAKIKAEALKTTATSMLMLAGAIIALSLVNKEKLEVALSAMTIIGLVFAGLLSVISKVKTVMVSFSTLVGLAGGILLLSISLNMLAKVETKNIAPAVAGLMGTIAAMTLAMMALAHFAKAYKLTGGSRGLAQHKGMKRVIAEMIGISLALIPLAIIMKQLGTMGWDEIGKGAAVMGAGLVAMMGVLALTRVINNIGKGKVNVNQSISIVLSTGVLAWAMGLVAVEIAALSLLDWKQLTKGIVGSTAAMVMLTIGMKSISKSTSQNPKAMLLTLAALSIFVADMSAIGTQLLILGQMKWESIGKGLTAMLGTVSILMGALVLLSKFSGGKVSIMESFNRFLTGKNKAGSKITQNAKLETSLLQTASALLILSVAIQTLATSVMILGQLKWGTIGKGLTVLAGAMAILVGITMILNRTGATAGLLTFAGAIGILGASCLAAGAGIAFIVWAVSALAGSLETAIVTLCSALINSADKIGEAVAALIVAMLSSIVQVASKLAESIAQIILATLQSMKTYVPDMAEALIDLIIAVIDKLIDYIPRIMQSITKFIDALFTESIKVINAIDIDVLFKGSLALAALTAFVMGLVYIGKNIGSAFAGFGAMLGVLTVLSVIVAIVIDIIDALGTDTSDSFASKAAVAASIGNVIGSLIGGLVGGVMGGFNKTAINQIDTFLDILKKFADTQVLTSLAAFTAITAVLSRFAPDVKRTVSGIAGLALLINALSGTLAILGAGKGSEANPTAIERGIQRLGLLGSGDVLIALTAMTALTTFLSQHGLQHFKKLKDGSAGIVGGVNTWKDFAKNLAELGVVIGSLLGVLVIVGGIDYVAHDVIQNGAKTLGVLGSPSVIVALAGMTALVAALSAISKISPGSHMKSVLSSLAGLGILIGGITALCLIASLVPTDTIQNGVDNMLKIVSGEMLLALTGMTVLTAALFGLGVLMTSTGGAGFPAILAGIASLAMVIVEVGAIIAAIGQLSNYLYGKHGYDINKVLGDGGDVLASIGSAIGKFFGGIIGGIASGATSQLPGMAEDFSEFITNLQPFIEGLPTKEVASAAKDLASALMTLTSTKLIDGLDEGLGKIGRVILGHKIPGAEEDNSTNTYKDTFEDLGEAVAAFASNTTGINVEQVSAGSEALERICEAINMIPKNDGIAQIFSGQIKLSDFADALYNLGYAIWNFDFWVKDIDGSTVAGGVEALVSIIEGFKDMPESSWWGRTFSGSMEPMLAKFASYAMTLGYGVYLFAEEVSNMSINNLDLAFDTAKKLVELISIFPSSGGMMDVSDRELDDLGSKLTALAAAIKTFILDVLSLDSNGGIDSVSSKLNALAESLKSFSESAIENITNAFREAQIGKVVGDTLDSIPFTLKSRKNGIVFEATMLMNSFVEAFESALLDLPNVFTTAINGVVSAVHNYVYYEKMYSAGKYFVSGFANGIDGGQYLATEAAARLGNATSDALDQSLDINSPSDRTRKSGGFFTKGFVLGLLDYANEARNAGSSIADAAAMSLQDSIYKISNAISAIDMSLDSNPTITPILDLSQVSNGVNRLNGMFSMNPSIGVMGQLSSISTIMNKNQNGGDDEVLKAIQNLNETIKNTPRNTYTINGITYSEGSEVSDAINTLIRAAKIERRM